MKLENKGVNLKKIGVSGLTRLKLSLRKFKNSIMAKKKVDKDSQIKNSVR